MIEDFRLKWLKYFYEIDGLVLVYPEDLSTPAVSTVVQYFRVNDNYYSIKNYNLNKKFMPLSHKILINNKKAVIIYFLNTIESTKSIKRKLENANQKIRTEYVVLENWKNPRWFLPISEKYSLKQLNRILNPSNLRAKVGLILFMALCMLELEHLVFKNRIIVACSKDSYKNEIKINIFNEINYKKINKIVGEKTFQSFVYAGSFGPLQKFTIEAIGCKKKPVAYIKIGHDHLTKKAIEHENQVLKSLSKNNLRLIAVPECRLVDEFDRGQDKVIVLKSLCEGTPLKRITPLVIKGLIELYRETKLPELVSLDVYINELINKYAEKLEMLQNKKYKNIYLQIQYLLQSVVKKYKKFKTPICLSHGDFSRWNVKTDGKTLNIIDWEEAYMRAPGYDILYFIFVEDLLINRFRKTKITETLIKIAYGKGDKNIQYYFNKTCPNIFKNPYIYVILFIAEITFYYLWHAMEHENKLLSKKNNLDYVISTMSLSINKFYNKTNDYEI